MAKERSSVLIITLWIVAILAVFAVGLAHRVALNLRIAVAQEDRLKADFIARAGVNYAVYLLTKDAHNTVSRGYDTILSCGVVDRDEHTQEELFSRQWDEGAGGEFRIGHTDEHGEFVYGFQDEESRININGYGLQALPNDILFKELFGTAGIDNPEKMAGHIAEFISTEKEENPAFKNEAFMQKEEFLAALENYYILQELNEKESRKKANEDYNKLKDMITVNGAHVNINTVSNEVLSVLAQATAKMYNIDITAADSLLSSKAQHKDPFKTQEEIDEYPAGGDGPETTLYNELKKFLKPNSYNFSFTVIGTYRGAAKEITAVYDRKNGKLVSWHEK